MEMGLQRWLGPYDHLLFRHEDLGMEREIAQLVRALAALAEDPGSVLTTHITARNCL